MRLLLTLTITAVLLITILSGSAIAREQAITLQIPESTLAEALTKSLPIQIDQPTDMINGVIIIEKISRLRLADNSLSALISLSGTDLQVSTAVAGHQIRLNIGTVAMDFTLTAALRYEQAERTLFILPQVTEMDSHGNQQANEIGSLLAGLFNGQEFPVTIDRFQPIVTTAGSKELTIDMQLKDVTIVPQALVLYLLPAINAGELTRP